MHKDPKYEWLQVTGEATYTDDVKLSPDALHGVLVASTRPFARVLSVDPSQALEVCRCLHDIVIDAVCTIECCRFLCQSLKSSGTRSCLQKNCVHCGDSHKSEVLRRLVRQTS